MHNGIIENYLELREFLQQKGVKFASQTDTEVVAQLMEYCMGLPEVETVSDALYMVLHRIEGAYALGILCSDDPDHVYAARKDAPLLIGFGEGENFIASDVTALVKHTRDIVYMEDGEVAILGRDGVQVYNAMELPIEKSTITSIGRSLLRKRAGMSILCSRRSWRSPRRFAGRSCPASKTARSASMV